MNKKKDREFMKKWKFLKNKERERAGIDLIERAEIYETKKLRSQETNNERKEEGKGKERVR